MIIDATNLILGRLASHVAKLALRGEKVSVVNAEKAVITGSKRDIFEHYLHKREIGDALKGPYFPKRPDMILKRTIRGMLPYKKERGKKALKRVTCFLGVPIKLANQKLETIEEASVDKLSMGKYISLAELSERLGWKK